MALKNIIADALGAYLSQMITTHGLPGFSGIEEGRFPKWLTPIIVPKGAIPPEMQERDFIFDSPLKLTTLGFGIGFAGFLWYASQEMDRAQLSGADQMEFDLSQKLREPRKGVEPRVEILYIGATRYGEKWGIKAVNTEDDLYIEANTPEAAWEKAQVILNRIWQKGSEKPEIVYLPHYGEAGHVVESAGEILDLGKEMSEFWEPEQPELFEAKRTLTLEMEDIAKSEDPIFACMERRGYTRKQMDRFTDSIAAKATIDILDKEPEKLTSSETKFQDDIQSCIDTVIKVFGSLEAAGYEDCDCD
jgi:DNA replication initiation complex subunit (GINS family)